MNPQKSMMQTENLKKQLNLTPTADKKSWIGLRSGGLRRRARRPVALTFEMMVTGSNSGHL